MLLLGGIFYNEFLHVKVKGTSTCRGEFPKISCAASVPISLKSVEIVVIPFKIIFLEAFRYKKLRQYAYRSQSLKK